MNDTCSVTNYSFEGQHQDDTQQTRISQDEHSQFGMHKNSNNTYPHLDTDQFHRSVCLFLWQTLDRVILHLLVLDYHIVGIVPAEPYFHHTRLNMQDQSRCSSSPTDRQLSKYEHGICYRFNQIVYDAVV